MRAGLMVELVARRVERRTRPSAGPRAKLSQYENCHPARELQRFLEPPGHQCMMARAIMNTKQQHSAFSPVTRRSFLKTGAIVTAGIASLSLPARAQVNKNSKLRIFQIGVGGIGGMQRGGLKGHPMVEWAGFCDVDRRELDTIKTQYPGAWTLS